MTQHASAPPARTIAVLYNAACPICRFEIDHYRRYAQDKALPIEFEDLNDTELARWGLSPAQAARKLHVRRGETLLSGVPAFIALWSEMERYRWLGRVLALPGIHRLACLIYDHALAPILYHRQKHRYASAEKYGNDTPAR